MEIVPFRISDIDRRIWRRLGSRQRADCELELDCRLCRRHEACGGGNFRCVVQHWADLHFDKRGPRLVRGRRAQVWLVRRLFVCEWDAACGGSQQYAHVSRSRTHLRLHELRCELGHRKRTCELLEQGRRLSRWHEIDCQHRPRILRNQFHTNLSLRGWRRDLV